MLNIFKSKEQYSYLEQESQRMNPIIDVSHHSKLQQQLNMIELTRDDLAIAQVLHPLVKANVDQVVDDFYEIIAKNYHLISMIEKHSSLSNLKRKLTTHIIEMFSGVIDDQFIQKRIAIANMHVKIGLTQKWYIASFNTIFNRLMILISKELSETKDIIQVSTSLHKLLNLEQQVVLEAYDAEMMRLKEIELQTKIDSINSLESTAKQLYNLATISEDVTRSIQEQTESMDHKIQTNKEVLEDAYTVAIDGQRKLIFYNKPLQKLEISLKSFSR